MFKRGFFASAVVCAILFAFFIVPLFAGVSCEFEDPSALAKWWQGDSALGDYLGLAPKLADRGIVINGTLQMDVFGNPVGGKARGATFDLGLYAYLTIDLEKFAGWKGGTFQVSMFEGTGRDISERVGNIISPSEVWVGFPTIMFYNLWLEQQIGEHLTVKGGRISAGDDFMTLPVFANYVSSGVNTNPISLFYNAPISLSPATSWGMNVQVTPGDKWTVLLGAYQVTPRMNNPNYHGLDYSVRPDNGVALITELGWSPVLGGKGGGDGKQSKQAKAAADAKEVQVDGLPGAYKVGGYYTYGGNFESSVSDIPPRNTYGFYWLAQQMVWQEKPGSEQGLTPWVTFTFSPQQDVALLPFYVAGGLQYQGLVPRRDDDLTLFATYYGLLSNQYAASESKGVTQYGGYELVFEWSYRMQLNKFFYLQPDVQWVIPSPSEGFSNALVIGGEIGISF